MADNTMFSASGGPGVVAQGLSGTWTSKPDYASVPVGTIYFATDAGLGGSHWYANATGWKSVSKSIPLLSFGNEAGFVAAASSAEQIFSDVVVVPGGVIESGDKLQWVTFSEDAGTADAVARTLRVRVHTGINVMSGGAITSIATAAAANNKVNADKSVAIFAAGTRAAAGGLAGAAVISNAHATTTVDFSTLQYIGFTVQNSNTLVAHNVYYAHLMLEKGN